MRSRVLILVLLVGLSHVSSSALAQVENGAAELGDEEVALDLVQKVLVVPFRGSSAESDGLASLMEQFVIDGLSADGSLLISSLEDMPSVEDVDAPLYYRGCPKGEELGCQLVLGELGQQDRVVGGVLTLLEDGGYEVEVTILNVRDALVELSYRIELLTGEEDLLPQTVSIALRDLLQYELDAPLREAAEEAEAEAESERRARIKAASDAEAELIGRMVLRVDPRSIEEAEANWKEERAPRVTKGDLEAIKSREGAEREWDELGLTEKQYLSYKNSRLDFERWRWRWTGHRLQLIGSVHFGLAAGATGLKYYGNYLLSPDLQEEPVDSYSWQALQDGQNASLGASVGFGVLRNLDIELGFWWSRSKVEVKLVNGQTEEDGQGNLVPDTNNRAPGDFTAQTLSLWGGELMARFYLLTVFPVRPSVGAGLSWVSYPSLYNDPDIPDAEEVPPPSIPERYTTWPRLVDLGVQLEPGVTVDIGRHFGVFLRVPISVGFNSNRRVESGELPRPIIDNAEDPPAAPFGTIRVVLGVQGRAFGAPVRLRTEEPDEDILDEDE